MKGATCIRNTDFQALPKPPASWEPLFESIWKLLLSGTMRIISESSKEVRKSLSLGNELVSGRRHFRDSWKPPAQLLGVALAVRASVHKPAAAPDGRQSGPAFGVSPAC